MHIEVITSTQAYDHERRVNGFLDKVGLANLIPPMQHFVNTVEVDDDKEELHYTTIITYRG
jgi:hypothetical protein